MLVFLSVLIMFLSLLGNQFRIHAEGHIDMFVNDGYIAVKLLGIKLFKAAIHFESDDFTHNNLIIDTGKKKNEIHLNADKKDKLSITRIVNYPAFDNVQILKLDFSVKVGKHNDAFFTSLILGAIRLVMLSALSYVKSKWNTDVMEEFSPEFNSDKFEIDFSGIISISIADIIFSYLISKVHKAQKLKEVRGT